MKWRPAGEALKRARIGRNQYRCAICQGIFKRKEVERDHCTPMIPLDKTTYETSLDEIAERLFVPIEGYQILCNVGESGGCHGVKTCLENTMRAENKAKKEALTETKESDTLEEEKLDPKQFEEDNDEE